MESFSSWAIEGRQRAARGKRAEHGDLLPTGSRAPGPSRPEAPQAQGLRVTRAWCRLSHLPRPSPRLPGPWENEPFSHPPLPHNTAVAKAAPTPLQWRSLTLRYPRCVERAPHATQSSRSLCTLSSTCGIFKDALGHLSWVA